MCCRAANFLDDVGERLSRHCETVPKLEVLPCSVIDTQGEIDTCCGAVPHFGQ
jgi:hypothetical protein